MFVPADPKLDSWVEVEVEFAVKRRRYDLGLYKISEVEYRPVSAKSLSFTDFKDLYDSVKETVRWMVAEGKYSKEKIVEEVSQCYGLHPEYAEIFVRYALDEFNACEVNGNVVAEDL